jgi:hypothetical protein
MVTCAIPFLVDGMRMKFVGQHRTTVNQFELIPCFRDVDASVQQAREPTSHRSQSTYQTRPFPPSELQHTCDGGNVIRGGATRFIHIYLEARGCLTLNMETTSLLACLYQRNMGMWNRTLYIPFTFFIAIELPCCREYPVWRPTVPRSRPWVTSPLN